MATKKRYSDINKAIKEAEARREEYYKQVGRMMLEEYPELGDMNVTDMRRAARFLRDKPARKGIFEGCRSGQGDRPERSARRVRFGRRFRPRCTRAYAREGLRRGHVKEAVVPPSGTPQGVSGVPRSEWRVLCRVVG